VNWKSLPSLLFFVFTGASASVFADNAPEKLRFCTDHYPPSVSFPEESLPPLDQQPGPFGYAIDQLTLLAEKTGLSLLVSPNTPFKRCLKLMETGQTDIMYGLVDSAERRTSMYLFPFRAAHPKVFVLLKDSPRDIASFGDLAGRYVAVARGFKFFPEFDKAEGFFNRVEVATPEQGLMMLLNHRDVDTVIVSEHRLRQIFEETPALREPFRLATYQNTNAVPVHIALSRQSPHAARLQDFQLAVDAMVQQGDFDRIQEAFNLRLNTHQE
jgi:polar amino acid transport system substrate-binding protein